LSATDIVAVNVPGGVVMTDDGQMIPITNYFDVEADECEPETARAVVAGPDADGKWWTIGLHAFGDVAAN
jgi:hypothetical protein